MTRIINLWREKKEGPFRAGLGALEVFRWRGRGGRQCDHRRRSLVGRRQPSISYHAQLLPYLVGWNPRKKERKNVGLGGLNPKIDREWKIVVVGFEGESQGSFMLDFWPLWTKLWESLWVPTAWKKVSLLLQMQSNGIFCQCYPSFWP